MSKLAKKLLDVGIHYDVPAADYHADCSREISLSRSVAWKLAEQAPIHGFLSHPRLNEAYVPEPANTRMKLGSVCHELLLGQDSSVVVGKFKDFKTDAAQEWRDEVLAAGRIPVLQKMMDEALVLRDCALGHIEAAGFISDFQNAKSEVSVIGKLDCGSVLRARFDKLLIDLTGWKNRQHSEIAVAFDIKITGDVSPRACAKQMATQGYAMQKKFYLETLKAADKAFAGKVQWINVFIESDFPHCATFIEIDAEFDAIASVQFERALKAWREGRKTNNWPTFMPGLGAFVVSAPRWVAMQELEDQE